MKLQDWAHGAEIFASFAVVVTLVVLSLEIRDNTRALDSQAIRDRSTALNAPYATSPKIPAILAKVKAIDGPEPGEQALIERYGLTYEEAGIWGRFVSQVLTDLEAEYVLSGESQQLEERIQLLFSFPDVVLNWEYRVQLSNQDFGKYVERVRELPNSLMVEAYRQELKRLKELQTDQD